MTSSQKPASSTHATDEDAAKAIDGASLADYRSSDMARAVDEAQGDQGPGADRKVPTNPGVTDRGEPDHRD